MWARWHKPDVILVVSPALLSSAMAVLRARFHPNRPAVAMWIQDLYSRGVVETGTGGGTTARLASALESLVLRSSDGVAAIHDRFKDYIVAGLGVSPSKVRVIRNWTHLPESPKTGLDEMRRKLGWNADDIVVLHAGNMGKKQGLENVIEAARIAESRDTRVRFVLMGDGNQRERLERMAQGLTKISFIRSLPESEFLSAIASADVLLVNELPGVKDMAVPSKLTSYFNAGVPVIAATDELSVTAMEVHRSGGGLRVDAADPLALVVAAETLDADPDTRQRMVHDALRFRHETLSETSAVADYDDFIKSLASSRGL